MTFPARILAVPLRMVWFAVRGLLTAIITDPVAAMAFGVLLLTATLCLPPLLRSAVRTERWIARHVAADRDRREFNGIIEHSYGNAPADDPADDQPQRLPGVVRTERATPPATGRQIRRRMPRIPGRPRARRHTTSSSSDRRR